MAASTWAVSAIFPITRMYYAYNDTRTPVYCSTLNLAVFVIVSLILGKPLGHAAIAAGTSAGAVAQLIGLLAWLPRRVGPTGMAEVGRAALRCTAASIVMGGVVYDVARLGRFSEASALIWNVAVYGFTVLFGAAVYLGACVLLRVTELNDLTSALRRRRK